MSATTIEIPAAQVEAIRASLNARADAADDRPAIEALLAQLAAAGTASPRVTAPRPLLWSTAYDALCAAAEALADDCNDHWREGDPERLRRRLAAVAAGLELLAALGPPPAR
ncbi:MAG: hypothetical protein GXY03_13235 [Solirubrobacterales bacterium]|nr:hypothetical protein [Solirubrobacterales bacterium]